MKIFSTTYEDLSLSNLSYLTSFFLYLAVDFF